MPMGSTRYSQRSLTGAPYDSNTAIAAYNDVIAGGVIAGPIWFIWIGIRLLKARS